MEVIRSILSRFTFGLTAVLSLAAMGPGAARAQSVPPTYQDLYNTLNADLGDFNNTLDGLWNGSKYPVLYTGELTNANSNNGPQMLGSTFLTGVNNQLLMLKAMGDKAVAVEVSFPMLYQPFFSFVGQPGQYQQFVNLYAQVAGAVRAQGFKLIVESQSMIPYGLASTSWGAQLTAFYPTLNWTQYQAARAQTAKIVAETMKPDYMVLLEEPDTEATQTGQANANTAAGSTSMLDQMHASVLQAGVPGIKIGAGIGSWLPGFQSFINSFAGQQCSASQPCVTIPLDFVDMHLFPVNELGPPTNYNFWQNALTIVSMAAAAGKPLTIAQAWLRKVRNSEWGVLDGDTIESREVYSFWAPLDTLFLQTVEKLANYAKMVFVTPFNTQNYSAYLTYSGALSKLLPSQLFSKVISLAFDNSQQAIFTSTGTSYYHSIVSPPDTIPPSAPPNLTAVPTGTRTANVSWGNATDNVGVVGYYILRDGAQIATTVNAYFQDSGLSAHTTYTYEVKAFDLASHVSPPAITTVTTGR